MIPKRHTCLLSVLAALASLHSQGLFHGHVTPGRVLFSSPSQNELGAATAKLCYLEKVTGPGDGCEGGNASTGAIDKDCRCGRHCRALIVDYLNMRPCAFSASGVGVLPMDPPRLLVIVIYHTRNTSLYCSFACLYG